VYLVPAIASVLANWSSIFRIINDVGQSRALSRPLSSSLELLALRVTNLSLGLRRDLVSSSTSNASLTRRVDRPGRGRGRADRRAAPSSGPTRDEGGSRQGVSNPTAHGCTSIDCTSRNEAGLAANDHDFHDDSAASRREDGGPVSVSVHPSLAALARAHLFVREHLTEYQHIERGNTGSS
jgi:hypothetical protein